jgi:subtilisin family serine protease
MLSTPGPVARRGGHHGLRRAVLTAFAVCAVAGLAGPATAVRADTVRNAEQPVLRALGASSAWRASTGRGVTVAVLDSGVDGAVRDLAGSVATGPDYTAGINPPGYRPPREHGTYIASLIAGHGSGPGRTGGVIGIAPAAHILAVRVLLEESEPGFVPFNENAHYQDTLAKGIRYAVAHGAGVINMSLGGPNHTSAEVAAIGAAISHGVVVIAAAGNDGTRKGHFTPYSYPASVPGVISVAAVTAGGRHAFFSDHNGSVLISAPGVGVVGAGPGGEYLDGDGTSQASALVSGVAALIRAKYPGLPPALVRQAIVESARHRPSGGYNTYTGFGEVNASAAIQAAARLARGAQAPAAMGFDPAASAGGAAAHAPIRIVHHDGALLALWGATAVVGAVGFIVALMAAAALLRRSRPARSPHASDRDPPWLEAAGPQS